MPVLIPADVMRQTSSIKIKSILDLFEVLSENERIIVDVLRQIII